MNSLLQVLKYNKNHGPDGRFARAAGSAAPDPYFHGTTTAVLASIMAHGLVVGKSGGGDSWAAQHGSTVLQAAIKDEPRPASVFMTEYDTIAADYAGHAKDLAVSLGKSSKEVQLVILELHLPVSVRRKLKVDEFDPDAVRFEGTIRPEWIKVHWMEEVEKAEKTKNGVVYLVFACVQATESKLASVLKYNKNHDGSGRFASKNSGAASGSDTPDFASSSRKDLTKYFYGEHGVQLDWQGGGMNRVMNSKGEASFRKELAIMDDALKSLPAAIQAKVAAKGVTFAPLAIGADAHGLYYVRSKTIGLGVKTIAFDAKYDVAGRNAVIGQSLAWRGIALHEIAHSLETGNSKIRSGLRTMTNRMGGKAKVSAFAESTLGTYSKRNAAEFIAESFSFYHTRYAKMSPAAKAKVPKAWSSWIEGL